MARPRDGVASGLHYDKFALPGAADSAAQREALAAHARRLRDIASLRELAEKETQMNRRVEFNLEIKRLEAELAAATKAL